MPLCNKEKRCLGLDKREGGELKTTGEYTHKRKPHERAHKENTNLFNFFPQRLVKPELHWKYLIGTQYVCKDMKFNQIFLDHLKALTFILHLNGKPKQ